MPLLLPLKAYCNGFFALLDLSSKPASTRYDPNEKYCYPEKHPLVSALAEIDQTKSSLIAKTGLGSALASLEELSALPASGELKVPTNLFKQKRLRDFAPNPA